MKKLICIIAGFLFSGMALAAGTTANISWTETAGWDATSCNGPCPAWDATQVLEYRIFWKRQAADPYMGTSASPAGTKAKSVSGFVCGVYLIGIYTVMKPVAPATVGVRSVDSSLVTYNTGITCLPPIPGTPTGITIN